MKCIFPGCGRGSGSHVPNDSAIRDDSHMDRHAFIPTAYVAPAPQPDGPPHPCWRCGAPCEWRNGYWVHDCSEQPTPPATPDAPPSAESRLLLDRGIADAKAGRVSPVPATVIATPDAPVCVECGKDAGHWWHVPRLNEVHPNAHHFNAGKPAAPKQGAGDALPLDLDRLWREAVKDNGDIVPSDIRQLIGAVERLRASNAALTERVRQVTKAWVVADRERAALRAQLAALTTPSIHTGASAAETIDALTSEVAGLRAFIAGIGKVDVEPGVPTCAQCCESIEACDDDNAWCPGRQAREFLAAGAK